MGARPSVTCATRIASVPVGGGAWHTFASTPDITYPYVQLRRPTATVAYLLPRDGQGVVYRTGDGGRSWSARTIPGVHGPTAVAAVGPDDVWALAGVTSATATQDKTLWHSHDGGQHWTKVASTPAASSAAGLPERGIVQDLVAASAVDLYAVTDTNVGHSPDAGVSWSEVRLADNDHLTFVDARHGWSTAGGSALYATVDGVHWQLVDGVAPPPPVVVPSPTTTTSTTLPSSTPLTLQGVALAAGPDGFLVPQGWSGGPAVNSGGPASFSHYRPPSGAGAIDYEVSGGEMASVYNPDQSPNISGALQLASCRPTSQAFASASRATFTCPPVNGLTPVGVIVVEPFPQGWKMLTVALPPSAGPSAAAQILNSVR